MTNTTELEQQAKAEAVNITRIIKFFHEVKDTQMFVATDYMALKVALARGYVRRNRNRRIVFTDEGKRFFKSMKKFAPYIKRVLA